MKMIHKVLLFGLVFLSVQYLNAQVFGPKRIVSEFPSSAEIVLSDLDSDGLIDMVCSYFGANTILWHKNLGNGIFDEARTISSNANRVTHIHIDDLDGDNDFDILFSSMTDNKIAWFENVGNGNFSGEKTISVDVINANYTYAKDLDGDGDKDVLSTSDDSNELSWFENNGNGTFGVKTIIETISSSLNQVQSKDVNGDGYNDIIAKARFGRNITWFKNDGNGNFGEMNVIDSTFNNPPDFVISDLDSDGDQDIISAESSDRLVWFQNDGNGNFTKKIIANIYDSSIQVIGIADFDNDGDEDAIYGSYFDEELAWFKNNGDGSFDSIPAGTVGFYQVTSLHMADLDGDFDIDVAAAASGSSVHEQVWYENIISEATVVGRAFFDIDENGSMDIAERGLDNIPFDYRPNNFTRFTRMDGTIVLPLYEYSDVISLRENDYWSPTSVDSIIVGEVDTSIIDTVFFGLSPIQKINDLTINIVSDVTRCNREVAFQIVVTNTGTTVLDGSIQITNVEFMEYLDETASPSPENINNGQLSWDLEYLYPNESFTINLDYLLFGPPEISVGDSLCLNVEATFLTEANEETVYYPPYNTNETDLVNICHCTGSGLNPYVVLELPYSAVDGQGNYDHANHGCDIIPITDLNNDGNIDELDCLVEQTSYTETTFIGSYKSEIRCSFDPNDKAANPTGIEEEHLTLMGQDIIYTIRFQNTGNDTAFRVELIDFLSEYLDVSTFDFITASHQPVDVTIESVPNSEQKVLKFLFEDILLPDSTVDQSGSNGFVQFSIRPKTGLPEPTILTNNAGIYFDLNPPVITNTVLNTLVYTLPRVETFVIDQLESIDVAISPNPFINATQLTLNESLNSNYDVRVFDITGKFIRSYLNQSQNTLIIQKDGLANGMYILNLYRSGEQNLLGSYKLVVE